MRSHHLDFGGAILERGFWLYLWHVTSGKKSLVYVGRTGDSSSKYAASPFNRLGQHLDVRKTATANMLLRHVRKAGLDPVKSHFKLFTIGPIFPEQEGIRLHRKYRDIVAALEAAFAKHVEGHGHKVVGRHSSKHPVDPALFSKVVRHARPILEVLPARKSLERTRQR